MNDAMNRQVFIGGGIEDTAEDDADAAAVDAQ